MFEFSSINPNAAAGVDSIPAPYIKMLNVETQPVEGMSTQKNAPFVVVGIFSKFEEVPKEAWVELTKPERLFYAMKWKSLKLRGLLKICLSLKGVRTLSLYKVPVPIPNCRDLNMTAWI